MRKRTEFTSGSIREIEEKVEDQGSFVKEDILQLTPSCCEGEKRK